MADIFGPTEMDNDFQMRRVSRPKHWRLIKIRNNIWLDWNLSLSSKSVQWSW